jgi:hypothetical protein
MTLMQTYMDVPTTVLTMYLTQYALLRAEPNRSGALSEKEREIEKNVKFEAKL